MIASMKEINASGMEKLVSEPSSVLPVRVMILFFSEIIICVIN